MTGQEPVVAVLVGTDHHPFDRLVQWVSELAERNPARWIVQHGTTVLPAGLEGTPMLSPRALQDLLIRADAVVCHGGPGLIMEARAVGHVPVVVARDPALGEHVDDHQQRFLGFVGRRGLVVPARSAAELAAAVGLALTTSDRGSSGMTTDTTSLRFGSLVDTLLHRA